MFYEDRCTRCGECLRRCHYLDFDQYESKLQIEKLISGESSDVLSRCATCAACNIYCPNNANPFDLILKRNEQTDVMLSEVPWFRDFLKPAMKIKSEVIYGDSKKPALSLCAIEKALPYGIGGAMFEGMTQIKGGDYFCMMGHVHLGQKEMIADLLQATVLNLADTGCSEIILLHDECYSAFHVMCKEFGIDIPFRYRHIFEYMLEYLKNHKDRIHKLNLTVGVQIPCSGRYTMEMQSVLDEIFELIGVKRPVRCFDRENGLCCGFPIMPRDEIFAAKTRAMNLDDVVDAGADTMAMICPICVKNLFMDAGKRNLNLYMIHDLVRMAIGETLPDPSFLPMNWEPGRDKT